MKTLTLDCKGEKTSANPISRVDPANLLQAENFVIDDKGRLRRRRGFQSLTGGSTTAKTGGSVWWEDVLFHHATNNTLRKKTHTDGASSLTDTNMGSLTPPTGEQVRMALANKSLYLTSNEGIKVLDDPAGELRDAGIPAPYLNVEDATTTAGTGAWLTNGYCVAYRAVIGLKDANGRIKLSYPSERAIIRNGGGTARYVGIRVGIPASIENPEDYFLQLYRTSEVLSTEDPGEDTRLVYERQLPPRSVIAVGAATRSAGTITATTNANHMLISGDQFLLTPGETNFQGFRAMGASTSHYVATSSSAGTRLVFAASTTGGDGSNGTQQTVIPTAMQVTDYCPDDLRGEPAYFGSVLGEDYNYAPPLAKDLLEFKGQMLYANWETPYSLTLTMLADPAGPNGIQNGYAISFGRGHTYIAGPDEEADFVPFTSGTAALNIQTTMERLVYAINHNYRNRLVSGNLVLRAEYISGPDDAPGTIRVTGVYGEGEFKVSVRSQGNSWSPALPTAYLSLPGTSGRYASTPDSAALSITGDMDVRALVSMEDWTPAANQALVSKGWNAAPTFGWLFYVDTSGLLHLIWSNDGTTQINKQSTVAPTVSDRQSLWVRATLDVDNGAAGNDVKFYTSTDGYAWTQLGATVTTAGVTSIFDNAHALEIGARNSGANDMLNGRVYYAEVRNVRNSDFLLTPSAVAVFNPGEAANGSTSFVSGQTGETWTINSTATITRDTPEVPAQASSFPNSIQVSKYQEPDAVALEGNTLTAGPANSQILRLFPQADGVLIYTDQGLYALTGNSMADFRIDPLDLTCVLLAKNSLASLNGKVIGYTSQGIAAASIDSGVQVISGDIDRRVRIDLSEMRIYSSVDNFVGWTDESEGRYFLYADSGTDLNTVRVYNAKYQAWTRWTLGDSVGEFVGTVRPSTRKIYWLDRGTTKVERKDYLATDFTDTSSTTTVSAVAAISGVTNGWTLTVTAHGNPGQGDVGLVLVDSAGTECRIYGAGTSTQYFVRTTGTTPQTGAATIYSASTATLKWSGIHLGDPGMVKHFTEAQLAFGESHRLYTTTLSFSNETGDFSSSYDATIPEKDGVSSAAAFVTQIVGNSPGERGVPGIKRVGLPRGVQRSKLLYLTFTHLGAMEDLIIDGVSVKCRPLKDQARE